MKGIVFTEFIEMVEDTFGWEMAEDVLEAAELESGGVYTAVGTYSHEEIIALVVELSKRTDIPAETLVKAFGKHLFSTFSVSHPIFLDGIETAFQFLGLVENHIHVEVRKLYPDAELPSFAVETNGNVMLMTYSSARPLADLAEGLLEACIAHFDEPITLARKNLADDMTAAQFTLTLEA